MKKLSLSLNWSFKIVQFTDLHFQDGGIEDQKTLSLMEKILDEEKPDLVVITGDIIRAEKSSNPIKAFSLAARPMEKRKITWCSVFGNHDDEGSATKEVLMNLQQSFPHCLSRWGDSELDGIGNYDLEIFDESGKLAYVLYFFDSGTVAPSFIGGYDWIKRSQIDWYVKRSNQYTITNYAPVPSLAFFHIPLPEYKTLWEYHACYGSKYEAVGCPKINSGLFTAMVEMQDMKGTFVGHDHVNDFYGDLFGIRLAYGRATGFNTYGKEGFLRGARIIDLEKGTFKTWVRLEDGSVIAEPCHHQPEGILNGKETPYVEVW
jgi:hypothetical protein